MTIFPSLLVLPTEEWQRENVKPSVVIGDKGRLGNSNVCLRLQETTKMLITLFTKLKAYLSLLQNSFTNDSRITLFCACEIFRRGSPQGT